jgi:hypothetical protein
VAGSNLSPRLSGFSSPPSEAAGPFPCYRAGMHMIGLILAALFLVAILVGLMLWIFFLRER